VRAKARFELQRELGFSSVASSLVGVTTSVVFRAANVGRWPAGANTSSGKRLTTTGFGWASEHCR
jgi:hypothetical protein